MKKKIIIHTLAFSLALGFVSCQNKLDLKPEDSLSGDAVYLYKGTAMSTLYGVYSTMQTFEVYGSFPQLIADIQTDNVEFVGSFPTIQDIYNYNVVGANLNVRDVWRMHYSAILRANKVIAKIPGVPDPKFLPAEKNQAVAEAKFLRAVCYFQLSNLFAQPVQVSGGTNLGVPLVLDAFDSDVTFPARASLKDVQTQIEKDLTEALPNLPDATAVGSAIDKRGRATKGAVNAMLSRLYLYQGAWGKAEAAARAVLASSDYKTATDYSFYKTKNTPEDVFTIQNSAIDNGRTGSGGWASFYNPAAKNGRGDAPFSADLLAAYAQEPGDKRLSQLSATGVATDGIVHTFTTKFPDATTNADNSPVIRTTEVVLNLVEAIAQQKGVDQEAVDLMTPLRVRAGLAPWTVAQFASPAAFIDAILNERRKELAFEGHRRMDLLRNKKGLRSGPTAPKKSGFGEDYTIMPIPQRELDINKALVKNPGY